MEKRLLFARERYFSLSVSVVLMLIGVANHIMVVIFALAATGMWVLYFWQRTWAYEPSALGALVTAVLFTVFSVVPICGSSVAKYETRVVRACAVV